MRAPLACSVLALFLAFSCPGAWADCPSGWNPLASGLEPYALVYALGEYNGQLVAAGIFAEAGGNPASNIARWNGETWRPLGSGFDMNSYVFALAVYADELIAGGEFSVAGGEPASYIAGWNGAAWRAVGDGVDNRVYGLMVYQGELVAGGAFTHAGGTAADHIAAWNGTSWRELGGGVMGHGPGTGGVSCLTTYHGELIASGYFDTAGGTAANNIARWNGSQWQALGSGMVADPNHLWASGLVAPLAIYRDELIAGGDFDNAGGVPANRIAAWNGAQWHPLGAGFSEVLGTLAVFGDLLIAGGEFRTPGNYLAQWDGTRWQEFGGGADFLVESLCAYNGDLIAGGPFAHLGGTPVNGIARWGCQYVHGDLNCDGQVDFGDINPFVLALTDPAGYVQQFPGCYLDRGDVNGDGRVDFGDINPFVALLASED